MRELSIRHDLDRAVIGDFALPLGITPGELTAPNQGFTVAYTEGKDDDPDTYAFHVVASHERLVPILTRAFDLLPPQVFGIVEIGSRDAYRSVDVFIGREGIPRGEFLETWMRYRDFLLEDGTIAAGANSDEPFIEVFLDQWKGISIHVPLAMREQVETMLRGLGLDEVEETWPGEDGGGAPHGDSQVRQILVLDDEFSPDVDELLLQLRREWQLELNIDPEGNVDDGGRELGLTLWHAVVIVEAADDDPDLGAYASVWATAGSLGEMQRLIGAALEHLPEWRFSEIYTIDRVAYDERPDEMADLSPRRVAPEVHLMAVDPWNDGEEADAG